MPRTSVVNSILVKSVSTSSRFAAGDCEAIEARARALAVQRQVAVFFAEEADFAHYPLFAKPLPRPEIDDERIAMTTCHQSPYIKVNRIVVLGVDSASTLQIGFVRRIDLEARTKHFRQFVTDQPVTPIAPVVFCAAAKPETSAQTAEK